MSAPSLRDTIMAEGVAAKANGKKLFIFAARYAYAGEVSEVGDEYVALTGACLPFETGEFKSKKFANVENFPHGRWVVMVAAIESFGVLI